MTDDFNRHISRPSRYMGNEINSIRKDHGLVDLKVALAFPDTYEIGMSHTGLKILYEILNSREDTAAERVFAPWRDMEESLRSHERLLCTLESGLPIKDFDILGFTLQYELSYTNILNMLDLAGIPVLASERDGTFPLVIGGGSCAFNPEPLADFFDLFVIGDGEEVIGEIADVVKKHRSAGREILLDRLEEVDGIYVPSRFEVSYAPDGRIAALRRKVPGPERIKKRLVRDLDKAPYPCSPVVPYMKVVHDRVALEISRGCTRGCRFCQAGMIYRPVREREVDTLVHTLRKAIQNSGHEEVSLTSLSAGDYTALSELVQKVVRYAEGKHVSVSLPSLRPGTLTSEIISEILKIRKTGFTIAPEAGSQRLRNVINKGIEEKQILDTVQKVFASGWEVLKLYFMIGLPTETDEDLQAIIDLSEKVLKTAKKANPRLKQINVSVTPFVPKPHTPFQWFPQNRLEEMKEKYRFIKRELRHKKLKLKWTEPELSMLEGLFSRGDRRIGSLLHEAWRLGCRFDGWTEEFDFEKWMKAFEGAAVDPSFYLYRERSLTEILPWGHIQSGVDDDFLAQEYTRSLKEESTPDCREGVCSFCGACESPPGLELAHAGKSFVDRDRATRQNFSTMKRFRIRYTKEGPLRFLSHLELVSLIIRTFTRAGIPLEYSKGFHPHPKIAMGPALSVGVSGTAEYLDANVMGSFFEESLMKRLNTFLPEGVRVTGVNWIPAKAPAISSVIRFAEYLLEFHRSELKEDVRRRVVSLLAQKEMVVVRKHKGKTKSLDIRPLIEEMAVHSEDDKNVVVRVMVQSGDKGSVRINELIECLLGRPGEGVSEGSMTRIGLYVDRKRTAPFQQEKAAIALQTS